ncbi:hypothetical protein [Spirosoma knui]
MKKQFAIQPAQMLKKVAKQIAKSESANILMLQKEGGKCCESVGYDFSGLSKPVFSL